MNVAINAHHKVRFKFVLCQNSFLKIMCWQWQLCSISFWATLLTHMVVGMNRVNMGAKKVCPSKLWMYALDVTVHVYQVWICVLNQ